MRDIFAKTITCLITAGLIAYESSAYAQPAAPPEKTRTMASLTAEGYEIQDIRIFPDKIWMRKADGTGYAFICDRGRINSPSFDAYRNKRYEEITCSMAQ